MRLPGDQRRKTRFPGFTGTKLLRFEVAQNTTLEPGGYAECHPLLGEGEDTSATVTKYEGLVRIFDGLGTSELLSVVWGCNYYVAGERGTAAWNQETKRYEVLGSFGLRRRCKASAEITAGGSGSAKLLHHGVETSFLLHVHYDHITVLDSIAADSLLVAQYYPDVRKWIVEDHGCSGA